MQWIKSLFKVEQAIDPFILESAKIELETAIGVLNMVVIDLEIPTCDSDNLIGCADRVGSLMRDMGHSEMALNSSKQLVLNNNFLTIKSI